MNKQSEIWKTKGGEWSDKYWKYENTRGRQLVDYFKDKSVDSFLEVGCNSGRNLAYLHKNFSDKELSGIEISAIAAADARKHIPTATIYEGDIHEIEIQEKYDVVYTGGVLMHIEPKLVTGVAEKIISASNKYIVHMEPIGNDIVTHGPPELNPVKPRKAMRCLHNIERIYGELGYNIINRKNYLGSKEAFVVIDLESK
jgi:SAM-dependent methyltransferase